MGTHMDGLNHLQIGDRTYNGHRLADIAEEHGTTRLGVDTLPQVVTRGAAASTSPPCAASPASAPGDVITPDDVDARSSSTV